MRSAKTQEISAPAGGTFASASGTAALAVPAGALSEDTTLTLQGSPATEETASAIFDFGPDGLTYDPAATLSVAFSGEAPEGKKPMLAVKEGDAWVPLAGSAYVGAQVSAPVDHFSEFTVIYVDGLIASTDACPDFQNFVACGGDLEGSWTITDTCLDAQNLWDEIPLDCTEGYTKGELVIVGEFTVEGTTQTNTLESISITTTSGLVLSSCPAPIDCSELNTEIEGVTCFVESGTCVCQSESTVIGQNIEQTMQLTIDGGTASADDGSVIEFCFTGDQLVTRTTSETGEIVFGTAVRQLRRPMTRAADYRPLPAAGAPDSRLVRGVSAARSSGNPHISGATPRQTTSGVST